MNYLQEIYLLFSFAMKKGFFSSIHDKWKFLLNYLLQSCKFNLLIIIYCTSNSLIIQLS